MFLGLNPWLKNYGRVFNKFKPLKIWIKLFLLSFYSSKSCHLSEYTGKWFGGLFGARPEIFPPLKKIEVWVSCEAVLDIFDRFFYSIFFKMELNPLPGLLKIRFKITEIGLFYGGEHLGAKLCKFLIFFFWQHHFKMELRHLIGDDDVWNTSNTGCVLLMFY